MQKILFRADSSSTIGMGHIMRDLVLAGQFQHDEIIFATQDLPGNINHKIREQNYRIELLGSNDLDELIGLIDQQNIDMVVIDHYGIDYEYEKTLKEKTGVKIFVLDDTYKKHYCDILLNHNLYADRARYNNLVPVHCELRCGRKYTLIRDEFIQEKKNITSTNDTEQKNVFLAMGGSDHSNITIKILDVLRPLPNLFINVVTTTTNAHLHELKDYINSNPHIHLHINTDKIASLMHKADFAIVSPSVTLNEAFYMGLPCIAIKTAENQNEMYQYLLINNYIVLEKFDALELKKAVQRLLHE